MIRKLYTALGVVVLLNTPAFALTVKETLSEVLNTHPTIIEKLKNYNASVHELSSRSRAFSPKLDVQAEVGWQDISNSSTRYKSHENDVNAIKIIGKQLVYDGRRSFFNVAAGKASSRSALFSYFETANMIAFETVEAYLQVLKYFEQVRLAEENVSIHNKMLTSIKARVDAGNAGKSERERIQGRLASAQATLIVRQNDYRRAIYNLHKYLGRMVEGEELEVPTVPIEVLPAALNLALEKLRDSHPTLISADYNIEQRNHEVKQKLGEFKPYINLEASRDLRSDYNGLDGYDRDSRILLKMTYRLADGGERRDEVNKVKSFVHREKNAKARVRRSLMNGLQLSWTGYKLLESQLGAIRKSIVFTKKALNSYKEEFRLGKRLLINILDAENELQNSRALFSSVKYDLMIAKFRILFSLGTLAEDLGLSVPFAQELEEAKKMRPADKDELPYDTDGDADGIVDDLDVSPNSIHGIRVSVYGETEKMTSEYLSDPAVSQKQAKPNLVTDKGDLLQNRIAKDVPTRIDFVSFEKGSAELSLKSKILMRELIQQLKQLSADGLVNITVTTGEADSELANYQLSIKRAYNIKKILIAHNIEAESIEVNGQAATGVEKANRTNYMIVSVITDPLSFAKGNETIELQDVRFESEKDSLTEAGTQELTRVGARLSALPGRKFDLIVYSNDFDNGAKNQEISARRAAVIKQHLLATGLTEESMTMVAWGGYDSALDLYFDDRTTVPNRCEIIVKN